MAEWLKRLTESKEDREARQLQELRDSSDFKEMLKEQAAELIREGQEEAERKKREDEEARQRKLVEAEDSVATISEKMEDSPEPYVIVRSVDFTPEKGIQIKIDYNPAFIRYLRKNGVEGHNDDEVVRKWLAYLSHEIMQDAKMDDYRLNGVADDEMPAGDFLDALREIQDSAGDLEDDDEDESDSGWQ